LLAGCAAAPPARPDTGARAAAEAYLAALVRNDADAAYQLLHPEAKQLFPREAFARRAAAYVKQLGFAPARVHIRSCDEQADRAVVQVTLTDAAGSRKHSYRDGLVLKRGPDGWGIVPPKNFGQPR
jgi:hypothetical protein